MVMCNEVACDGIRAHDACNHRALPIGTVRVVITNMAVQVESLVRTEIDHLACTEVVDLGSSEASGIRGVYTLNVLGHRSYQGGGIAPAPVGPIVYLIRPMGFYTFLYVFIGFYMFLNVFICFYMFLYVFICFYRFLYVFICIYRFL